MAPDNGHLIASSPFSLPTNAPFPNFSTASRNESRQSSRLGWYSPFPPSSSSQHHARNDSSGHARTDSKDNASEDKAMATDAKRFTPNLHASLVSEILSLRRDIEGKNNALANLEDSLQDSKIENGQLTATVTSQEREIRSAKKQMQLLESGTLSALGDIAKERDDAVDNLADARKRLEASKSNVRGFEEDARRNQALWEQDKQNWDNEKRNIERKVHVAEGRLKTMVTEVAAAQNSNQLASVCGSELEDGAGETWFSNWSDIISTRSSSVRGRYHLSEFSNNTYDQNELANLRNSTLAARASLIMTEPGSMSLADELNFDEALEDHSGDHELEEAILSPDALPEEDPFKSRRLSVQSQDCKARKILGLSTDAAEHRLGEEPPMEQPLGTVYEQAPQSLQRSTKSLPTRQDMGTQYSPPSSPKTPAAEPAASERDLHRFATAENTANQRRKRVSVPATLLDSFAPKVEQPANWSTANAACQTMPQATSPPLIPMIALEPMFPDPGSVMGLEMMSCSTQTDDISQVADIPASIRDPLSSSPVIPVIAIHPPGSRPGSANNTVMLPPQTKNMACQTEVASSPDVKSISTQTEGIRVDKRSIQIPPRLMSGTVASKPHSRLDQPPRRPAPKAPRFGLRNPPPIEPSRNLQTRSKPPMIQTAGSHVAPHSDLSRDREQSSKPSPITMDDLFAGFSDQEAQGRDIEFSDDDDLANVAPIRKTLSKVQNSWTLVPTSMTANLGPRPLGRPISDIQEIDDTPEAGHSDAPPSRENKALAPKARLKGKDAEVVRPTNLSQKSEMRKAAFISSGALAHLRQRSPSEPSPSTAPSAVPPPFPVPTRSSSRKIPISSSEGNGSPSPYTTSFITGIRNRKQARAGSRNPLRKVRSAAAVPKFARTQTRHDETEGESSALPSPTSTSFSRPPVPRTPRIDGPIQPASALSRTLDQEGSLAVSNAAEAVTESPSQTTSVVDAIAQTMVGEWMLKYVRKRKSFGMVEPAQPDMNEGRSNNEASSGIRHKRWVWLAPYERAVIWSSKQPTSGLALMGKGGRKLIIQSVLDVQDDAPMPKNAGMRSAFNRSILIITPQRALKFTAPSKERHYIWLTALSFLSHSTLGMEDLTAIPPLPQAEYQAPFASDSGRVLRSPRDSLRIAKGKDRPGLQGRVLTAPVVKGAGGNNKTEERLGYDGANDSGSEAAEAPQIPRVSGHGRKRSSTGPRPSLQSAFYSFPSNMGRPSSRNVKTTAAQDSTISVTRGFPNNGSEPSATTTTTRQKREPVMVEPEAVRNDFFDAVGTVRMEAFVHQPLVAPVATPPGKTSGRSNNPTGSRAGRKKDMSYWGMHGEGIDSSGTASAVGGQSAWRVEGAFRGF
ncbi:MAG: hypothetical protein Q9169_007552 [Polycauliona sp. 2 TL-2023]